MPSGDSSNTADGHRDHKQNTKRDVPESELADLINAWPDLPEHIKAAIKALIQTHRQGGR